MSLCALCNAQNIVVGQIGPFTGLPSPDALHLNQGAQAYFDSVNARGGVRGQKIDFFKLDDKFDPEEHSKQLAVADAKQAVALITPVGTPALNLLLNPEEVDKHKFIILNSVPGAASFRKTEHPRVFYIRANDDQQIERLMKNANIIGIKSMAVLYQNLSTSASGFATAQEYAPQMKLTVKGYQANSNSAELSAAASDIVKNGYQSVLVIGTPKFSADGIAQLRKAGMRSWIFSRDYLSPKFLIQVAGVDAASGVGIAQTYPDANGKKIAIQTEFQKTMKQFSPTVQTYSNFHIEGYITARVLVEGLNRVSGTVSADKLAQALKSIKAWDLGGFRIDFSKSQSASNFVDIGVISPSGAFRY